MKTKFKIYLLSALVIGAVAAWMLNANVRGAGLAGGGARPSMGNVGGAGGRPAGGGVQRAAPQPQPSHANVNRPSMGNVARPSVAAHPSVGNFSPSGGQPNISRPTSNPGVGAGAHSNIRLPSTLPAINRPTLPSGGNAIANHPNLGNRPTLPSGDNSIANHPNVGNRPTLPSGGNAIANHPNLGNRPIVGEHPSFGNVSRPTTLPASIGRPGDHVRPGAGGAGERFPGGDHRPDHPIIGGGNHPDRPNRPIIGSGNRNAFINHGNINVGNHVTINGGNYIGARPSWDHAHWNNPGWGWGGNGGWASNWHNHAINGHYGWYNGCWNGGYWGSNWYRPVAWAAVGWGLGSLTSGWGYGSSYYNPYYVAPVAAATVPYDYSQPVVVNNYAPPDDNAGDNSGDNSGDTAPPAIADTPASDQARKLFDSGLALFKSGDYRTALGDFNTALVNLPGDPVVHEVRALTLYALGDYNSAAAALNSFLSSAPGMDWTTMSGLYGNADDYTAQYRKLEQYCQANPNDPASHFVLAYHDLVIGSKDAAVAALKVVVDNQPKDTTARRMLDALSAPAQTAAPAEVAVPAPPGAPAPPTAPAEAASPNAVAAAGDNGPQTDLVGSWQAKAGTSTIDLSITDDSQFTWKAVDAGKPPVELKGQLDANGDSIELQTPDKGSMAGSVKSIGPDQWQFALSGAPPTDPGLSFARVKN